MDKRLEEIRERLKLVQAGKPNTLHALNMADSMAQTDMPYLLDLVDTQAERIGELNAERELRVKEHRHAQNVADTMVEDVVQLKKQIEEGREIVEDELDMRQVQMAFAEKNDHRGVVLELEKRIAILDAWLKVTG